MSELNKQQRAALDELIKSQKLTEELSAEAEREAQDLLATPGLDDPDLMDLTHLPFLTIDNLDSMDLDQALHIERQGDGFVVRYALADAAYYIKPKSALFSQALKRGTSFYLPGLCLPMLPRSLSEGLISLNPDVLRRALVFVMSLDSTCRKCRTEIIRARIRSRAKLTYDGVQEYHDQPQGNPLAGRDITETLDLLKVVGQLRQADARARDVVQFNREEVEVEAADDPGGGFVVIGRARNQVSMWNEQISLLTNMEGARLLSSPGGLDEQAQPIYRVHDAPEKDSLVRLQKVIERVIEVHGLDEKQWTWRRGQVCLADYLDNLPRAPEHRNVRAAIERQILISNQRSVYSAEPGMHYALGVACYSRFSSPMREVVGIFTHKEALEKLGMIEALASPGEDEQLRKKVIHAANRARERQRHLSKQALGLAVAQLFEGDCDQPEKDRPRYEGLILGLRASRLYVKLDQPPIEVKVYLPALERKLGVKFKLSDDEASIEVPGPDGFVLRMGDRVVLRVSSYDAKRKRFNLFPVND